MAKYPIYLEIGGKKIVIIGGGLVALRKAESLCKAGALVCVAAKEVLPEFSELWKQFDIEIIERDYCKDYIVGAVMVFAATNDNELNRRIYADCGELNILCNVVDVPEYCDFYDCAVIERGPLQIAISTDGNSPAFAGKIRRMLEGMITDEYGEFVTELGAIRKEVIRSVSDISIRKRIFQALVNDESFEYFQEHGAEHWRSFAGDVIKREKQ